MASKTKKVFDAKAKKMAKAEAHKNMHEKYAKTFEFGKFNTVHLKAGSVKFSSLYDQHSAWKRYLIAVVIGIVMAFAVQFLLKNTGLYNSGLSAIIQGIARITQTTMNINNISPTTTTLVFNLLFWVLYAVANIPLFIFGYKKIGKTFAKLTMVYVIFNVGMGMALSYIPAFEHVYLFGNTIAQGTSPAPWSDPISLPHRDNIFVAKGVYNLPFWYLPKGVNVENPDFQVIYNTDYDPFKALSLFIYAFVYGLIASISYAVLYIIGGCTAGGDFVSIYLSSVKQKPLGGILIIINSSCMIVGSTIGSYVSAGMIDPAGYHFEFLLSANLIASFIAVVVMGMLLNRFFPMHRIVKVEIVSDKLIEVRDYLFAAKFTHSMSITKTIGAYSLKEKDVLWTICMYIEMPRLIRHIRRVDPNCLITVSTVTDIDGNLKVYRQGSTD